MKDLVFGKVEDETEKEFHKSRIAFMIIENDIIFLKNSTMSHYEWLKSLGIKMKKEDFNKIVRGFYLDGKAIFYKGNFEYDDDCISIAIKYALKVKEISNLDEIEVWCGQNIGEIGSLWTPKYFVGKF